MIDVTHKPEAGDSQGIDGGDPETIVAEAMAAYERGDLETLSRFVHPEAEIEMLVLQGDVAHGPEGVRDTLERARSGVHHPTATRIERVGDDAALMVGRIQYADPARGGVIDRKAVWLTVVRDGLIWRTRVFRTPAEARAAYAELHAQRPVH
jgi:ketosteroid isomerase-like protein